MPNTFAPNGFSQYSGNGSAPTYEQVTAAILSTNTTPIFNGDPVVQSVNSTGIGTGYIQQAYGPVSLTVSATGIATTAVGVMTITFTAISSTTSNIPAFGSWAPPVGSVVVVTNATGVPNGAFTITSATTSTAVIANSGSISAATSSASTPVVTVYVPVAGIFQGCKYLSTSQKRVIPNPYWIGSDAAADAEAYVVVDPNARFSVCTGNSNTTATAVGLNQVGQNISFAWNDSATAGETNGNTSTGFSTMFADQYSLIGNFTAGPASNSFLPFRIIGLQNYVAGQTSPLASINGNDSTSAYNRIIVGFNNAMPRNFAGI